MKYEDEVQEYLVSSKVDMKSRKMEHLFPRYYLMRFLRDKTDLSLASIGRIFKKDHSTIVHCLKNSIELEDNYDYQFLTRDQREMFPMTLPEAHIRYASEIDLTQIPLSLMFLENQFKRMNISL